MSNVIRLTRVITFFFLAVLVVGCASQTTQIDVPGTANVFLNKPEAVKHVSGNTETWSKGAGYYGEDGSLLAIWEGADLNGTWSAKEDGRICIAVEQWGGTDACHQYEVKDSKVQLVYQGESNFRDVISGNQLDSFR